MDWTIGLIPLLVFVILMAISISAIILGIRQDRNRRYLYQQIRARARAQPTWQSTTYSIKTDPSEEPPPKPPVSESFGKTIH